MTYLIPPIMLFIPLAPVVTALGLMDSRWALVLLYPTMTIPFCTWLMMGFFRAVPLDVEEAAWIDGCGVVGGLVRVVVPLAVPGIVTTALLAFTLSMQEYLYALVFASPVAEKVITVGLPTMLVRYDIFFWGRSWRGRCSSASRPRLPSRSSSTASSTVSPGVFDPNDRTRRTGRCHPT
jgi:multiple sugar transport system permease protein